MTNLEKFIKSHNAIEKEWDKELQNNDIGNIQEWETKMDKMSDDLKCLEDAIVITVEKTLGDNLKPFVKEIKESKHLYRECLLKWAFTIYNPKKHLMFS